VEIESEFSGPGIVGDENFSSPRLARQKAAREPGAPGGCSTSGGEPFNPNAGCYESDFCDFVNALDDQAAVISELQALSVGPGNSILPGENSLNWPFVRILAGLPCDLGYCGPSLGNPYTDPNPASGGQYGGDYTFFTDVFLFLPDFAANNGTTQTPYKNPCVTSALKSGAISVGIDLLGFLPEVGGVARVVGHQAGYVGIVADNLGKNMLKAGTKTTGVLNSATGFSSSDWTTWVSAGITAADFVPVLSDFATPAAIIWDTGVAAYKVYQCPK